MNLGIPLTEFVLETVLRDGLGELRADPRKFDYLFSRMNEVQFTNQYGAPKIAQIKTFLMNNQIKIVHAFGLNPTVVPCISIQMLGSEETPNLQTLGNVFDNDFTHKDRDVVEASVQLTAYDPATGKLTVADSVDLSTIRPNQILVDSLENEFIIYGGISNALGNKFLSIGARLETPPNLISPAAIVDPIDFTLYRREQVRLTETIRLGVHAKDDAHIAKFLYYIVYSILKSRQVSLIKRGIHLDYGTITALDRIDDFKGENIFTRSIDMRCQTEFNYLIDEIAVASSFDLVLKVPDPTPSSPGNRIV